MVKRRQRVPKDVDVIDLTGPSCIHIRKGLDHGFLKKTGIDSSCFSCQDCSIVEKPTASTDCPSDEEEDETSQTPTIWMCLKCGHRGCGRNSEDKHAIKHYEKPRSDPHCLVLSLDTWSVWCYICDEDVQYSKTGQLAQLVTNIKKQHSVVKLDSSLIEPPHETKPEVKQEMMEGKENTEPQLKETQKKMVKKDSRMKESFTGVNKGQNAGGGASRSVSVRGLSNLGNTCFFNAVVQNLSQTHMLRQVINQVTAEQNTSLKILPGGSDLPILVQLAPPGSLTVAMCQTINEIQETNKGVVTPKELFSQVCKKAVRFKGFQQQDSQELLRYLLDGMRAEEIKRVSSGISEALKQQGRDAEQCKKLVKEYERNGAPKTFVDQVFGGELTSTVMCQQCKTVQTPDLDNLKPQEDIPETPDLDDLKPQEDIPETPDLDNLKPQEDIPETPDLCDLKPQEDIPKTPATAQDGEGARAQTEEGVTMKNGTQRKDEEPLGENQSVQTESCETTPIEEDEANPQEYGCRGEDEEEDGSTEACEPAGLSSVSGNRVTALANDPRDPATEEAGTAEDGFEHRREEEENGDGEELENGKLTVKLDELSLNEGFLASEDTDLEMDTSVDTELERECTVSQLDPKQAFHTLASRAVPEKQECSVQSCLYQFTEVEMLTQNNCLQCFTCTKRQTSTSGSKKSVYTEALKQMLISCPPTVLTLHLKRFQQMGYGVSKVNRHVLFPPILDLAPFCSVNCKGVSDGGRVLYSLYGVVEHSGTMRGGHYTAYVKARPSYPGSLAGVWFHVSDSSVQPVSESKVQSSQAYLLFYERIS
uniref:Ubiquitin carboxyl-terminal hydrolase n=1 Tax=Esox lucius TaxID=8010 RepID=A0A6Q2ZJQ4_ESOLU